MNNSVRIVSIREHPEYLEAGIDYFTAKWQIDRRIYADCISHSLTTSQPLPRWYLMMQHDQIIGCYGLITNDFISRQDLYPWLCALYVEKEFRGRQLGSSLLAHGRIEAARLGFAKLYLATDHVGYYEKYGWCFIGTGYHPWGESSRIYEQPTIIDNYPAAGPFVCTD
ncbi:MAG: GNAT family N-acetyltransferase [Bacillota bacterium]|nr:GNAT family N-acetyltransferase [Bacillota bacterium]